MSRSCVSRVHLAASMSTSSLPDGLALARCCFGKETEIPTLGAKQTQGSVTSAYCWHVLQDSALGFNHQPRIVGEGLNPTEL